jgi:hypothetical protein
LFEKGQVGLINLEFRRLFDAFEQLALQKAELAAENERLKFELECRQRSYDFIHAQAVERMSEILRLEDEVEWLRKADRLVCWNEAAQEWQVRHEPLK